MTTKADETGEQAPVAPEARAVRAAPTVRGLPLAALQAVRPRQWPKNLLVFAAPLAGATLGRDDGFGYALLAFVAFTAAASAVYVTNDILDVERDRKHPTKRRRPIASGRLPVSAAVVLAAGCLAVAALATYLVGEPTLG